MGKLRVADGHSDVHATEGLLGVVDALLRNVPSRHFMADWAQHFRTLTVRATAAVAERTMCCSGG